MRSDREYYNELLDYYGDLLTRHQVDVLKDYYAEDLSMKEIAEDYQISKAAISDLIKRSLQQLEEYEKKLHLLKQSEEIETLIQDMRKEDSDLFHRYAEKLEKINRG